MQPEWMILAGIIVVAVVAIAVVLWIVFPLKKVTIHQADPILPPEPTTQPEPTEPDPAHPNIVDLSAFRERKHLGKEKQRTSTSADIQPKDTSSSVSTPPKLIHKK